MKYLIILSMLLFGCSGHHVALQIKQCDHSQHVVAEEDEHEHNNPFGDMIVSLNIHNEHTRSFYNHVEQFDGHDHIDTELTIK